MKTNPKKARLGFAKIHINKPQTKKCTLSSVLFWGCSASSGTGGTFKSCDFGGILVKKFAAQCQKAWSHSQVMGPDPKHRAKNTRERLRTKHWTVLTWLFRIWSKSYQTSVDSTETCSLDKAAVEPERAGEVCSWGVGQNTRGQVQKSPGDLQKSLACSDCLKMLWHKNNRLRVPSFLSRPVSLVCFFWYS